MTTEMLCRKGFSVFFFSVTNVTNRNTVECGNRGDDAFLWPSVLKAENSVTQMLAKKKSASAIPTYMAFLLVILVLLVTSRYSSALSMHCAFFPSVTPLVTAFLLVTATRGRPQCGSTAFRKQNTKQFRV